MDGMIAATYLKFLRRLGRAGRLLILLAWGASIPFNAHGTSGRTNKEGCHNSRTAGYHCHGGKGSSSSGKEGGGAGSPSERYKRKEWRYRSYKSGAVTGYYTGGLCDSIDIDHVVSLKDAHNSGGSDWSPARKRAFANDRENHVPACAAINRSKGASGPTDFIRKAGDGRGMDYEIVRKCEYVAKYVRVKIKYHLAISEQDMQVFEECR